MCLGFLLKLFLFCPQPFQAQLAATADPDKKQMLERLDAAVSAALQPVQAAMAGNAADEVVQPLVQVSPSNLGVIFRGERSIIFSNCFIALRCCWRTPKTCWLIG